MQVADRKVTLAVIFSEFIVLLSLASLTCAQEPHQNRTMLDVVNPPHDYFAVSTSTPTIQDYLRHVESFHVNKIQERFRQGDVNLARGDIKYTLDRFPNHPKALMLAGMGARLTKSPAFATAYYEKALKLYPQHALTHAQYGLYLVDIGQTAKGIAKLQYAVEMDPKLAVAHAWLAKAYAKSGNTELARQVAERATTLGYKK
jgi:Tfp pilus assembly protein PilF